MHHPTSKRRYNALYAGVHSFYWAGYATAWAYIAVLLSLYGFSATEIGIVTSLATLFSVALQPALASLTDRSRRLGPRETATALLGLLLTVTAALLLLPARRNMATALLFILLGLLHSCIPPFFNAFAIHLMRRGAEVDYGFGRGLGSLCYAFAAAAMGILVERCSPRLTLPVSFVLVGASLLVLLLCRLPASAAAEAAPEQIKAVSAAELLRRCPILLPIMLGCLLFIASRCVYTTYLNAIVERAGAGATVMGIVLALSAAMELPAMSLFVRFRRRFSCETLLCVCAATALTRLLLYLFFPSAGMLYVNALLQFFGHGLYPTATVFLISELVDGANQSKGQGLIFAAGYGLGCAIGSLADGWLLDRFSVVGALWFSAACALLSLLCFAFCARRRAKAA
ncbi:MAG: MFS transporter [Oscillospiraceae bacterium]